MKTLRTIFALLVITAFFYSCGDDSCKMCEFNGDPIGEYCDDQLKSVIADGATCK
jgi:hypothetical protein